MDARHTEHVMDRQTSVDRIADRWSWVRLGLVTAGIALQVLAMPALSGAEAKRDPATAATQQITVCEKLGGKAEVEVERTVEGVEYTTTYCDGGLADGTYCANWKDGTTIRSNVNNSAPGSVGPHITTIVQLLEDGSTKQITKTVNIILAQVPSEPPLVLVAAGDEDHAPREGRSQHGQQAGKKRH